MYTPEWNQGLNDGTQVGWISAVWAPSVLASNAPDTAGKWAAAPLPQWDASSPATGTWGGSTTAVTTQSEHKEAAVEFAKWLNTDPEAVKALADISNVYPADTEAVADALDTAPEFFSSQPDFYDVAAEAADSIAPFTYGPNVNVAYSAFNDEFAKAADSRKSADFLAAVDAMQRITVADMEKNGFTVR
ncbi:extracellular solute-binding protein [Clavibacter sepedonicus]|uniref:extracellular solute-binding protein n=1 Tax=Clavibacter TaxID=1573 RepID=UPI0003088899|nr:MULTISPECIES: extracellular solute-binding protein [Clavibacter]